jgi:hypothetical protein
MSTRAVAPGVFSHSISHWHEPTFSEAERRKRLQPLASVSRSPDGSRFKAVPDMDRFIKQMSDLAQGRFAGEPDGISDDLSDGRSAELGQRQNETETLILVQAPLIGNFFDATGGGREGGDRATVR